MASRQSRTVSFKVLSILILFFNNVSGTCDDELLDSQYLDTLAEIKSLLNYELTSGQSNIPLVRGRLALCYDEWVKLGA